MAAGAQGALSLVPCGALGIVVYLTATRGDSFPAAFARGSAMGVRGIVLFTMGAVGLLPLGVGTGPAAMVTALGATSLVTATAAGMVVSAATMIAVLIYASAVWAWRIVAERPEPNAPAMA